ncbi:MULTISPECIES: zinc ribbon domain-containing protein [Enterobacteriaceae]|uniref:zinc ribbon domain-containing protein n=1 Tax=Enterobacteriaceae TaxID=543 RepID=UPI0006AC237D|nr:MULTISPECIES: zinc ribbon domain-containing protein [Enterobacteriaceae]EBB7791848.1 zinc ribbon domain-containing protein [Salmonella enterica subsp. enterica serovar Senftenberg]EBF7042215.1 zinc ribbon domain-containing protein [Salmonella enterica subsp. enterica serovar Senftenberg]MCM7069660.1 zinc ribbon domain-containing protein [Enterobacter hormaechei]MDM3415666.1 zinc ribbon domain-containing protein [Citrobacter sp. Cb021]SYS99466.1 Uncharacterised protein [Klebsiella pneumoniae
MKISGVLIIIVGVLMCLIALNFDVGIFTLFGQSINNIGLENHRRKMLIISFIFFIAGVIIYTVNGKAKPRDRKCPCCFERIKSDAIKCKYCGTDVKLKKELYPWVWIPENYYILNNDGVTLNKEAVSDLIIEMIMLNPDISNQEIIYKYQDDIFELANNLPPSVKKEFIDFYYEVMGLF